MRHYIALFLSFLVCNTIAYTPQSNQRRSFFQRAVTTALLAPQAVLIAKPTSASAISPFIDDYEVVDGQQATGGEVDLNSAYVTDYKQVRPSKERSNELLTPYLVT